jgi:pilus assembly protein Flp/PilA
MTAAVARFLRDCSGATAIEYAIIGSIISIALVAGATVIGVRLNGMLNAVAGHFD